MMGWECPRCHRTYNPNVQQCHACPSGLSTLGGEAGRIERRQQVEGALIQGAADISKDRNPGSQSLCCCGYKAAGRPAVCPVHGAA